MKTIFDVGANDGKTFLEEACNGSRIYLFEPTPFLVNKICEWIDEYPNVTLIQKAVAEYDGKTDFNIAGQNDWGCSSLLEFSEGLEKTWPGRTDFKVTDRIAVETTRLDTFLRLHPEITSIDYLHVDTQGSDLSVLRSLGDMISIVQEGVVEVPQSREVMLYKGQHTKEDMVSFLTMKGFEVIEVISQIGRAHV